MDKQERKLMISKRLLVFAALSLVATTMIFCMTSEPETDKENEIGKEMDKQKMEKQKRVLMISKKLLVFVALSLVVTAMLFSMTFLFTRRFMISWFSFECGVIGGFVSIQQRLGNIAIEELMTMSESWAAVFVKPIFGGIFALVLYLLFLSGMLEGPLFPQFDLPTFHSPPTTEDIKALLRQTYPKSPQDFAKLAFWSFFAGFSERFVLQIIQGVTSNI